MEHHDQHHGMIIMIRCWAGSMAEGVIRCITNIESP